MQLISTYMYPVHNLLGCWDIGYMYSTTRELAKRLDFPKLEAGRLDGKIVFVTQLPSWG